MTRTWLIVAFAIGIALSLGDLVEHQGAPFAANLAPISGTTDTFAVTSTDGVVVSGGSLSVGDRVTLIQATWKSRIIAPTITVRDQRSLQTLTLTDIYYKTEYGARSRIILLADVLLELFALGLLVVRGNRKDVQWLSLAIFLDVFSFPFQRGAFLGPEVALLYRTISGALIIGSAWALVELAATVASSALWIRRIKLFAGILALVASLYTVVLTLVDAFSGFQLPGDALALQQVPALIFLCALVIFAASIRSAPPSEQRRLALLVTSAVVGNVTLVVAALSPTLIFTQEQIWISYVGLIAMTAGLAYGVLVEQMFDIGFVVNRAVVYAATSGLVVLAFIVIEWLVAKVATSIGHLGSSVVELGLAICVGLGLRPVHERVDGIIDTVFFDARHRAANALLRFSEECSEARSVAALIALTLERLSIYARPDACAIYLTNDEGDLVAASDTSAFPRLLSADDATMIRLRTSRDVVERLSFPMLTVADYAFPMARRGGLAGAIFIRLASKAEPYSPEERDAIATVARSVGAEIVSLEVAALKQLVAQANLRESAL